MKKTIRYLDLYRGIAVFILFISGFSWMKSEVTIWASALGIPVLFAANGVECIDRIKGKYKDEEIIKNFARSYLIPYIIFSAIYVIIQGISNAFGLLEYSFDNGVWDIVETVILYGKSILWFFPVAFVSSIIYVLIRKKLDIVKVVAMLVVLILCYHFVIQKIEILDAEENMLFFFVGRVFAVVWKSIIAAAFMGIGEIAAMFVDKTDKRLKSRVILGILLFISGTVCAVNNVEVDIASLSLGNPVLFYFGTVMMVMGLYVICEWIQEFPLFEFIGQSYILVLLSSVNYGLMSWGRNIDDKLLIIFDNKFVAHTASFIGVCCIEMIMIFVMYRYFYFAFGYKSRSNPYLIFKQKSEE